jgi:hypothetical protein
VKPVLTTIEKGLFIKQIGRLAAADQETLRKLPGNILGFESETPRVEAGSKAAHPVPRVACAGAQPTFVINAL